MTGLSIWAKRLIWHLDAAVNIWTKTVSGVTSTYTPDPAHPYAVDAVTSGGSTIYSASYDADGNMTERNGYQIQWTVDNLPTSIGSATGSSTFSYGPEHDRYYQSATFNGATTITIYVGSLFEVVSTATDTQYRHNIMADGQLVAVHAIDQSGAATTSYLHSDHLGSVDTITNDQGAVIQSMSFDAFGLRRDPSNWEYDLSQNQISTLKNYTDRGYTDQEQLDNVGLVHMNGRVYDPGIGRFISADPTISQPLFSQGFNRYAYVDNNPLNATDPSGFETDACTTPGMAQECDGPGGTAIGYIIGLSGPGEWGFIGPGDSSCSLVACAGPYLNTNIQLACNGTACNDIIAQIAQLDKIYVKSPPCPSIPWCQAVLTQQFMNSQAIQNFFSSAENFEQCAINPSACGGHLATPYLPLNSREQKDAFLTLDRADFWASRLARGDWYGQVGCAFWCSSDIQASQGPYWQTLGETGVVLLDAGLLDAGDEVNSQTIDNIGTALMQGYANFINGSGGYLPSPLQFFQIHQAVFGQYGVPMSFFGGTPIFGQPWELQYTMPTWCPQCYTNLNSGGGG